MPLNRHTWRPENMITNVDNPAKLEQEKLHLLGDKTLADVVEALMGAAYLTGNLDAALKCAIATDIPLGEITEWKHFNANHRNISLNDEMRALGDITIAVTIIFH